MRDMLEAGAILFEHYTGIHPSEHFLTLVAFIAPLLPLLFWLYLSIRRWRGDFRAVSSDLQATAQIISHDTTKKFESIAKQFDQVADRMQGAVNSRIDTLETTLLSKNAIDRATDTEVEPEAQPERQSAKTRLKMAEAVRDAVLKKWLEGRTFSKEQSDANIYVFKGVSNSATTYEIWLSTPYRNGIGSDGSLAFTLEVWADNYKKLNFEWDTDGNYALRGFKKGEWVDDLWSWNFGNSALDATTQVAAA